MCRITSYNVCYTKLLRLALLARIQAATGHLVSPAGGLLLLGSYGNTDEARPATRGETDLLDALSAGRIRGAMVLLEDPLSDPEGEDLLGGLETLIVARNNFV